MPKVLMRSQTDALTGWEQNAICVWGWLVKPDANGVPTNQYLNKTYEANGTYEKYHQSGHESRTFVGITAEGEIILGMDDDMQTHPSQAFKLIEKIQEGYDMVYGVYPYRKNSPIKNFTSKINKVTSRVMLNRPKEIESSNFWIITRAIRDEVVKFDTFNPYIDAIFYRATSNIGMVPVEHFKREYGHSGYTFRKLLKLWMAYWNFSAVPLRMSFYVGTFSLLAGVLFAVYLIINKILSPDLPVGWSSMMCIMALLFGVVLMVLGVVGEYLGKITLILNNTPQYVVRETVGPVDGNKE
jgi:undecaprenyl-phosphate 4-deoxy-4-formamido-L-arabinose transferase